MLGWAHYMCHHDSQDAIGRNKAESQALKRLQTSRPNNTSMWQIFVEFLLYARHLCYTPVNKTFKNPCLNGAYFLAGETDDKQFKWYISELYSMLDDKCYGN